MLEATFEDVFYKHQLPINRLHNFIQEEEFYILIRNLSINLCLINQHMVFKLDTYRYFINQVFEIGNQIKTYHSSSEEIIFIKELIKIFISGLRISQCPVSKANIVDDCGVCFENKQLFQFDNCKHMFCIDCINKMLRTNINSNCPYCRDKFSTQIV